MKYKAGDRVTVRPDLEVHCPYSMEDNPEKRVQISKEMVYYRGKELTIKGELCGFYRVEETGWLWADEMLLSEEDDFDDSPFDLSSLMEV